MIRVLLLAVLLFCDAGRVVYLPLVTRLSVEVYSKRGLAGGNCREAAQFGAVYVRQWTPRWGVCSDGAVLVPELWGPRDWNAAAVTAVQGSGWLLGANEADMTATIAEHAAAHAGYYEPACEPPCKLGSPALSQRAGVEWLRQWYDAYMAEYGRPPRLDFLDMHCYIMPGHGADACIAELRELEAFGDEIGVHDIVVSETGWPPREYWSRIEAWEQAQPWLDALAADEHVLWVALFATHVDEDAPWAGATATQAGWNWNELLSPGGRLTWDGRQWLAWGP